jgi:hypothetical protein
MDPEASSSRGGGGSAAGNGLSGDRQTSGDLVAESQFSSTKQVPWDADRVRTVAREIMRQQAMFSAIWPMMDLINRLQLEDLPGAARVAEEIGGEFESGDVFAMLVWSRWAQLDPENAAKFLAQNPDSRRFIDIRSDVILPAWAQRDRLAALRWAKAIPSENERSAALEKVFEAIARTDPEGALQLMRVHAPERVGKAGMPDDVADALLERPGVESAKRFFEAKDFDHLAQLAVRWARSDPNAAQAWANALPEGEGKARALDSVYIAMADKDRAGTLKAVSELSKMGIPTPGTVARLIREWPNDDVKGLMNWVMEMPPGKGQTEALARATEVLARRDPKATAEWLGGFSGSPARDNAVQTFARNILSRDAGMAYEWAATISDEAERQRTLHQLTLEWFRLNPGAAFDWMQKADALSPEEKRALLQGKSGKDESAPD